MTQSEWNELPPHIKDSIRFAIAEYANAVAKFDFYGDRESRAHVVKQVPVDGRRKSTIVSQLEPYVDAFLEDDMLYIRCNHKLKQFYEFINCEKPTYVPSEIRIASLREVYNLFSSKVSPTNITQAMQNHIVELYGNKYKIYVLTHQDEFIFKKVANTVYVITKDALEESRRILLHADYKLAYEHIDNFKEFLSQEGFIDTTTLISLLQKKDNYLSVSQGTFIEGSNDGMAPRRPRDGEKDELLSTDKIMNLLTKENIKHCTSRIALELKSLDRHLVNLQYADMILDKLKDSDIRTRYSTRIEELVNKYYK